jgi:hypothetical protein
MNHASPCVLARNEGLSDCFIQKTCKQLKGHSNPVSVSLAFLLPHSIKMYAHGGDNKQNLFEAN